MFIGGPSIDVVSDPSPTIQFGPMPGSFNIAFNVGPGDPRYENWQNGPGDVTGRLSVFFTNTAFDFLGLHFYPGDETGVYAGSFSVTYQYGPPLPVYACTGFGPPFDGPITVKTKVNRAIPLKMELFSNGTAITDGTIGGAAPVVNISFSPGGGPAPDLTGELLPLAQSDVSNQFRFDGDRWIYNLGTKSFTAAGTYTVTAMPGDATYLISPTCTGEFIRQ